MNFSLSAALFDLRQQKGCYRTQFNVNACVNEKTAVPLQRQNKTRAAHKRVSSASQRAAQQDNIINK
jgi:hypothetical protein